MHPLELRDRVRIPEDGAVQLDSRDVELGESIPEGEPPLGQPALEYRQRALAVGTRQGARRRYRRVRASLGERTKGVRGHERAVDREAEADVVRGRSHAGDEARERSPDWSSVVEERKGEGEPVRGLADGDSLVAYLPEQPPGPRRERLLAEGG